DRKAGRTISPRRSGSTMLAPKPSNVAESAVPNGTLPTGRSRIRQRSVRMQWQPRLTTMIMSTQNGWAPRSTPPTWAQSVPRVAKSGHPAETATATIRRSALCSGTSAGALLLAEARRELRPERLLGMDHLRLRDQLLLALHVVRVRHAAIDRAHRRALLLI